MRSIDAKRIEDLIMKHCQSSEDFGTSDELNVTNKQIVDGGLKELNHKNIKKWFTDIAIIASFIEEMCFKTGLILSDNGIETFGGAKVPSKLVPPAFKVKMSKQDREEFHLLHEYIKESIRKVRSFIYTYDGTNKMHCSYHNTMTISICAMEVCQRFDSIIDRSKYRF